MRPVSVEALKYTGENIEQVRKLSGYKCLDINIGDWAIRDQDGNVYFCNGDCFSEVFTKAEKTTRRR